MLLIRRLLGLLVSSLSLVSILFSMMIVGPGTLIWIVEWLCYHLYDVSNLCLSIYSCYAARFLPETLMPLHYFVFHISGRIPHQVVRLTRCINVPGYTAMLVRVMTETG